MDAPIYRLLEKTERWKRLKLRNKEIIMVGMSFAWSMGSGLIFLMATLRPALNVMAMVTSW